ncbi:MAG: OmpA family protein [Magnetovibrionaceae bacterium]
MKKTNRQIPTKGFPIAVALAALLGLGAGLGAATSVSAQVAYDPNVSVDLSVIGQGGYGGGLPYGAAAQAPVGQVDPGAAFPFAPDPRNLTIPGLRPPQSQLHVEPPRRASAPVRQTPRMTVATPRPAASTPAPTARAERVPAPRVIAPTPAPTVAPRATTPPPAPTPAPIGAVAAAPIPQTAPSAAQTPASPPPAPAPAPAPAQTPAPAASTPPPPAPAPTRSTAVPPPPSVSEPTEAAQPTAIPEPAPATQTAALPPAPTPQASPDGVELRIPFDGGTSRLDDAMRTQLKSLAAKVKDNTADRLQLQAFAGGQGLSASQARRLSLSRALAVRSYLIENGVRSTRIDVRALGDKTEEQPPNRVDVTILKR